MACNNRLYEESTRQSRIPKRTTSTRSGGMRHIKMIPSYTGRFPQANVSREFPQVAQVASTNIQTPNTITSKSNSPVYRTILRKRNPLINIAMSSSSVYPNAQTSVMNVRSNFETQYLAQHYPPSRAIICGNPYSTNVPCGKSVNYDSLISQVAYKENLVAQNGAVRSIRSYTETVEYTKPFEVYRHTNSNCRLEQNMEQWQRARSKLLLDTTKMVIGSSLMKLKPQIL